MKPLDMKKESIKLVFGLAYLVGIILLLSWLRLGFILTIVFFATMSLAMMTFFAIRDKKKISVKAWLKSIVSITLIVGFIRLLYYIMPPFWSYVTTIIFICSYIIYKRRKKWLEVKWRIESMIWGSRIKDLPKNYWKK